MEVTMSDDASETDLLDSADELRPNHPVEADSIEAYEDDDRIVLFDSENPLAWVETTRAVALDEHA